MRRAISCAILAAWALSPGCRSLEVSKHDPIAVTNSVGEVSYVHGGWDVKYWSYGLFTSFGTLTASVGTNGVAMVSISDLNSDVSTNHVAIIDASGKSAAEIAEAIIKALK